MARRTAKSHRRPGFRICHFVDGRKWDQVSDRRKGSVENNRVVRSQSETSQAILLAFLLVQFDQYHYGGIDVNSRYNDIIDRCSISETVAFLASH